MGKSYITLALLEILSDEKMHKLKELEEKLNLKSSSIRLYINELIYFGYYIESYRGKYGGYKLINSKKKRYYLNLI